MPVLQWSLLFLLSLLLSLFFCLYTFQTAAARFDDRRHHIQYARHLTAPSRCTFLGAQAILGCMIAQNLTGSILTTLTAHWPMVIIILLATLISSAVIGWLLVRYSNLPGNTGAWGSSRRCGGNGGDGAGIWCRHPAGGVYAVSARTVGGWCGGTGHPSDDGRPCPNGQ